MAMNQQNVTIEDLDEIESLLRMQGQREGNALERLLGNVVEALGSFIALSSQMGSTSHSDGSVPVPSYVVTHSLEWIGQHVKLGSEMPFMQGHIDPETGRLKVDANIADEVKQRAPDWTRQPALAAYLARPERKFGPIIAVVSPAWIDEPNHENWDSEGRAKINATEFAPLEPQGRVGRLHLDDTRVFALDGQHRVLGIRGIREVRDMGFLQMRNRDGQAKGTTITKEQFQEEFDTDIPRLQAVLNDSLVVEYIPAVVRGETRAEANRRVRAVFIAINSYAKRTDKGENILLDENDGFSIVARRIAVSHRLFKLRDGTSLVDFKRTSIPAVGNHYLTTLQSIRAVVRTYLHAAAKHLVRHWEPQIRGAVAVRPSESAIEEAEALAVEYFTHMRGLPIFRELNQYTAQDFRRELSQWRDFFKVNQRGELLDNSLQNRGHLLLRPLGQEILASSVASMITSMEDGGRGRSLQGVFRRLKELDEARKFEAHRPSSPWYGVTYSVDGGRILTRNASWAHRLLNHLVAGTPEEQEEELARRWKNSRMINRDTGEWMTASGRVSTQPTIVGILP
jgi:hypothetical protein